MAGPAIGAPAAAAAEMETDVAADAPAGGGAAPDIMVAGVGRAVVTSAAGMAFARIMPVAGVTGERAPPGSSKVSLMPSGVFLTASRTVVPTVSGTSVCTSITAPTTASRARPSARICNTCASTTSPGVSVGAARRTACST